jgi:hypothetical protein
MSGSSCGEDRLDENKIGSQREREREVLLIVTCLFKGPCFATELLATSSVFVFLELRCTIAQRTTHSGRQNILASYRRTKQKEPGVTPKEACRPGPSEFHERTDGPTTNPKAARRLAETAQRVACSPPIRRPLLINVGRQIQDWVCTCFWAIKVASEFCANSTTDGA